VHRPGKSFSKTNKKNGRVENGNNSNAIIFNSNYADCTHVSFISGGKFIKILFTQYPGRHKNDKLFVSKIIGHADNSRNQSCQEREKKKMEMNEAKTQQVSDEQFEQIKDDRTLNDFSNMDKDKLIFNLWRIIDNIDTFGDMAKSNDEVFRSLTEKEQQKRWQFVDSHYIDLIYDKYYERCCKNGK
jgi:hypothetical protein